MIDGVRFKNFKSLRDVSVEFDPITVLVGQNGAGKSSLLQAIWLLLGSQSLPGGHPGERLSRLFSGRFAPARIAASSDSIQLAAVLPAGRLLSLSVQHQKLPQPDRGMAAYRLTLTGPGGPFEGEVGPGTKSYWDSTLDAKLLELSGVEYLHLDAGRMAATSAAEDAEPRVGADGAKLASTLAWMAGAEPQRLIDIARDLSVVVPQVKSIRTFREVLPAEDASEYDLDGVPFRRTKKPPPRIGDRFAIEFTTGEVIPSDQLSEGTVLALGLLTKLHEPNGPKLLLLDDIDQGLHIAAQAQLIGVLRALMKLDSKLQIVCTSHSPYLLDLFAPSEVRVVGLDAERRSHVAALTEHPDYDKWRFGTQTGELWAALGDAWVAKPRGTAE